MSLLTNGTHAPAANTAAVVTLAARTGGYLTITSLSYSYSAEPTGGNLQVESPAGTVIWQIDILLRGENHINFERGLQCAKDQGAIVTLAAGGAGISGKVNVITD